MSDVEKLSNVELVGMYAEVASLMSAGKATQCKLRDEILRRVEETGKDLLAGPHVATVTTYESVRTSSIEDIREHLGDEFVDANLPVLTKKSTGRRIKIKPNV